MTETMTLPAAGSHLPASREEAERVLDAVPIGSVYADAFGLTYTKIDGSNRWERRTNGGHTSTEQAATYLLAGRMGTPSNYHWTVIGPAVASPAVGDTVETIEQMDALAAGTVLQYFTGTERFTKQPDGTWTHIRSGNQTARQARGAHSFDSRGWHIITLPDQAEVETAVETAVPLLGTHPVSVEQMMAAPIGSVLTHNGGETETKTGPDQWMHGFRRGQDGQAEDDQAETAIRAWQSRIHNITDSWTWTTVGATVSLPAVGTHPSAGDRNAVIAELQGVPVGSQFSHASGSVYTKTGPDTWERVPHPGGRVETHDAHYWVTANIGSYVQGYTWVRIGLTVPAVGIEVDSQLLGLEQMREAPVGSVLTYDTGNSNYSKIEPDTWLHSGHRYTSDDAWRTSMSNIARHWHWTQVGEVAPLVELNLPQLGTQVQDVDLDNAPIGSVISYNYGATCRDYTKVNDTVWRRTAASEQNGTDYTATRMRARMNNNNRTHYLWTRIGPEPVTTQPEIGSELLSREQLNQVPIGSVLHYNGGEETRTKEGPDAWRTHNGRVQTAEQAWNINMRHIIGGARTWRWVTIGDPATIVLHMLPEVGARLQEGDTDRAPVGSQFTDCGNRRSTYTKVNETDWTRTRDGETSPAHDIAWHLRNYMSGLTLYEWTRIGPATPAVGDRITLREQLNAVPVGSTARYVHGDNTVTKTDEDQWTRNGGVGHGQVHTTAGFWDTNVQNNLPGTHWTWTRIGPEQLVVPVPVVALPQVGSALVDLEQMRAVNVGSVLTFGDSTETCEKTGVTQWNHRYDREVEDADVFVRRMRDHSPQRWRWTVVTPGAATPEYPVVGTRVTQEQIDEVPTGSRFGSTGYVYTKTGPDEWDRFNEQDHSPRNGTFARARARGGSYRWLAPAAAQALSLVGTRVDRTQVTPAPIGAQVEVSDYRVPITYAKTGVNLWLRTQEGVTTNVSDANLSSRLQGQYTYTWTIHPGMATATPGAPVAPVDQQALVREVMAQISGILDRDGSASRGSDRFWIRELAEWELGMRPYPVEGGTVEQRQLRYLPRDMVTQYVVDGVVQQIITGRTVTWQHPSGRYPVDTTALSIAFMPAHEAPTYANRREFMVRFWEVYDRTARAHDWCSYVVDVLSRNGIDRTTHMHPDPVPAPAPVPEPEPEPTLRVGDEVRWTGDWERSLALPVGSILQQADRHDRNMVRTTTGWLRLHDDWTIRARGEGVGPQRVRFIPLPEDAQPF